MINLENISLIIFDLGGVLLNIDYQKTEQAMVDLGISNFSDVYSKARQSGLFDQLETGKISGEYFIQQLQQMTDTPVSEASLINAWNAMLEDFPSTRLLLLEKLKARVTTALYSNTNEIHLRAFNLTMLSNGVEDINQFFHRTFYSHKLGYRKPDPEGFELILKTMNVEPDQTLFIDDSLQHVEGARRLGIHSIHLPVDEVDITDLFPDITQ